MPRPEGTNQLEISGLVEVLRSDDGGQYEIYLPESPKDRLPFENEFCRFTPVGWVRMAGIWYPLGYKVVTDKMESLGLRNNPTIMKFPIGTWVREKNSLVPTEADWGGIWTAQRKGSIKMLQEHCSHTWGMKTKGYLTAIANPVFANSYRIKSEAVMILNEVKSV